MKTKIQHDGMWWRYIEICDRCGDLIHGHEEFRTSSKPNTEESDFCLKCLRYLVDNNIPYEKAQKYNSENNETKYFIIYTESGIPECYGKTSLPISLEDLCERIGYSGCTIKIISKEEYEEIKILKNNEWDIKEV